MGFNLLQKIEIENKNAHNLSKIVVDMMHSGAWRKQF
jgi:hypothetical protein